MAKTKNTVDTKTFVTMWMDEVRNGGNMDNLAQALGVKTMSVYHRSRKIAEQLMEKGVTLPHLKRSARRKNEVDVDELVALVQGPQS